MSSPRAEFSTARLVSVATIVLAVGLLIVSSLVLFDDYKERRDERALRAESSEEALEESLAELEADLSRSLAAADDIGNELANFIGAAVGTSEDTLAAAVLETNLGRTFPPLDRVIYQDSVAQIVGVDRFGIPTLDPTSQGFNSAVAAGRTPVEPFTNGQGDVFVSDGFAAYYPVGEEGALGWVVLILHGDKLAVDSSFDRIAAGGTTESEINNDGANANLSASVPFIGSDFVATRQVPIPGRSAAQLASVHHPGRRCCDCACRRVHSRPLRAQELPGCESAPAERRSNAVWLKHRLRTEHHRCGRTRRDGHHRRRKPGVLRPGTSRTRRSDPARPCSH